MKYFQICRSHNLEQFVNAHCRQSGSFVHITTQDPTSTETRLDDGWCYWGGPRRGTKTPPLAYFSDWKVVATWGVDLDADIYGLLRVIRRSFDRPCVIADIERRLMNDDKVLFPELNAKDISKNGLENVFCLPRLELLSRDQVRCSTDVQYQDCLTQVIIAWIDTLIHTVGIDVIDDFEVLVKDEKEVHSG